MSIEDIIKRGFKNEASYTQSDGDGPQYYSTNYSYRLKDKGDVVCMEEKTTNVCRGAWTQVMEQYHVVKSWSKQGKYPIGINNIPYEGTMVMQFSDGSLYKFKGNVRDYHGNYDFVEIKPGNSSDSQTNTVSLKEQKPSAKKPSEEDMKALDRLIDAALEDFIVTDEERATLLKKADSIGLSRDEFKMILDSRIQRRMKEKPDEKIEEKKKGFFARLFGK